MEETTKWENGLFNYSKGKGKLHRMDIFKGAAAEGILLWRIGVRPTMFKLSAVEENKRMSDNAMKFTFGS